MARRTDGRVRSASGVILALGAAVVAREVGHAGRGVIGVLGPVETRLAGVKPMRASAHASAGGISGASSSRQVGTRATATPAMLRVTVPSPSPWGSPSGRRIGSSASSRRLGTSRVTGRATGTTTRTMRISRSDTPPSRTTGSVSCCPSSWRNRGANRPLDRAPVLNWITDPNRADAGISPHVKGLRARLHTIDA